MDGSKFDDFARALGHGTSRRTLLRGLAAGLAGVVAGAVVRTDRGALAQELTICHATGDPTAPYQTMTIPQTEMNLHARHGDFVRVECCADGDCPNQYGECGRGACTNGYCVQLPVAAGTPCGGQSCVTGGVCDGAFTCTGSGVPVVCAETEHPCTTAICSEAAGGCQEVPANEGGFCSTPDFPEGICEDGACVAFCPTGVSCTFDNGPFENALGICANNECICKPSGVPGLCDCFSMASVVGCCSAGCLCAPGTCL